MLQISVCSPALLGYHYLSSGFFSFGTKRSQDENKTSPDWTELRDRWEYSHVARAGFALVSFIALVMAISSNA